MNGQLSLFDFMPEDITEPPILLRAGEVVYRVVKADIKKEIVEDEKSWLCGENERGYRMKVIGGCWDCTWNREIGVRVFKDLEQAQKATQAYLRNNKVLTEENINAVKTVAYQYEYYGKTIVYFYSILESGLIYVRSGGLYEHISNNIDAEMELWDRCLKSHNRDLEIIMLDSYKPAYRNMYPCKNDGHWVYACCDYQSYHI